MFYRQSIVIFGIVVPAAICAIIVGGGFFLKSKATASFQQKLSLYKSSEQNRIGSQGIEKDISKKREHVERWTAQLERETANSITSCLKEIADRLPSKEFQQTAVEYLSGEGTMGTVTAQKSSQVKLAFRGTYRSVQRAFLELETLMPQLQLQELKIDPSVSSSSTMNFAVTYTSWEK
jgi:hypothetical protein